MLDTNINIYESNIQYTYLLRYEPQDYFKDFYVLDNYDKNGGENITNFILLDKKLNINNEDYIKVCKNNINFINETLMKFDKTKNGIIYKENCKIATIKIFLPRFSPNLKYPNLKYNINMNIWVGPNKINLGSFIFSPFDALAHNEINKYNNLYNEYLEFEIPDPYELYFSQKSNVLGEQVKTSSIYVTLTPIINRLDNYEIADQLQAGQNSIPVISNWNKKLQYSIKWSDYDSKLEVPQVKSNVGILGQILFQNNPLNKSDLKDLLTKIYNIDVNEIYIKYELVLKDFDNLYKYIQSARNITDLIHLFKYDSLELNNWEFFKPGLKFQSSAVLTVNMETGNNIEISLLSQELLLTKELYARILALQDETMPWHVDLNENNLKDMKIYNINAVNKTINKIQQINSSVEDAKSNIIQPIFYKVYDLGNIIIHPDVNENICINLDRYKSQVNRFSIQIAGVVFPEMGRTSNGVVFKITGKTLAKNIQSGIYYILNEKLDLITTGKYTCEK